MSGAPLERDLQSHANLSAERLLQLLDLATEVLEGLDELGVSSRTELLELMDRLERLVSDEN
jgi:hypothetical protein